MAWCCLPAASAQEKLTREQYIQKYKAVAIEHQDVYGIPASIKLAQAILESENGNSRLACEANNHFGIKCKSDWRGETITHDDDARGECFRKYACAEDSFKDHSEFLDKSPRYQNLFQLDPADYKGWAYTLKEDGYATATTYPERLIKIIEENELFLLDRGGDVTTIARHEEPVASQPVLLPSAEKIDPDNYMASSTVLKGYPVLRNNGSEFVVARPGDTYASLSALFGQSVFKMLRNNDCAKNAVLEAGDAVYLKPKARKAANGKIIHIAAEGETLHSIAQRYGIKLRSLASMNRRPADSPLIPGQQIRLM